MVLFSAVINSTALVLLFSLAVGNFLSSSAALQGMKIPFAKSPQSAGTFFIIFQNHPAPLQCHLHRWDFRHPYDARFLQ